MLTSALYLRASLRIVQFVVFRDLHRPMTSFRSCLRADLLAALSLAGLLLPEAVAYAGIANLPPQAGVMAMFAGLCAYALLGQSRFAIVTPTSSAAAILAIASASLGQQYGALAATALVFMTGLLFLAAAIAGLGRLTDFIARPVLHGFSFGLAVVIVCRQLAHVLGIHLPPGPLLSNLPSALLHAGPWNWAALTLAAASFGLLSGLQRIPHLPAGLCAVLAGIACSYLPAYATWQISSVGQIDLSAPVLSLPLPAIREWGHILEISLALVLILYAESYGAIRSAALVHGDKIAPNRDLLALGVANLLSALCHGLAVGAGFSATAANQEAGAQSRMAGVYAAVLMALLLFFFLPWLERIPQPVLAAIVIHALSKNLGLSQFKPYFTWHRDRLISVAAVLAVLLLGVLDGLLAAVALSMILLLHQIAKSNLVELARLAHGHDFVDTILFPQAQKIPGVLILRPEEALFFANAERIMVQARHMVRAAGPELRHVVLSLEESPDLDGSSIQALLDFAAYLQQRGQHLAFARLKEASAHVLAKCISLPPESVLSVDQVINSLQAANPPLK